MASFEDSFNESFGDELNMEEKILPPLVRNTTVIEEEKTDAVVTQGLYKGIISIYKTCKTSKTRGSRRGLSK